MVPAAVDVAPCDPFVPLSTSSPPPDLHLPSVGFLRPVVAPNVTKGLGLALVALAPLAFRRAAPRPAPRPPSPEGGKGDPGSPYVFVEDVNALGEGALLGAGAAHMPLPGDVGASAGGAGPWCRDTGALGCCLGCEGPRRPEADEVVLLQQRLGLVKSQPESIGVTVVTAPVHAQCPVLQEAPSTSASSL